ncbi:GNAT family N-acetyltransferase [Acidomonas methanolica]|uniref:Uncharacterized protein n=1 Tax=Acidomonas methanolica NBRC 104435 TaxID=1231351 RepID=A0A023D5Q6_ACIMT|nr:hypothetical protein [Acidomonas methanolica]MBU2653095.1 hypothetical protein [Acidomonas methanolica]GAJ29121.1 hypothetical protein Amme_048_020 [Acidomonas methanolica NBRC 104435]GBQ47028.1 hypothetical protein AA0498_0429 [Acidomonas methanolica]GEK99953.1 hypothetical protein AME01nite_24520 [Acidomonas methanolica NBRC 104435]
MIETERLRLSLHQMTDFRDLRAMWSDPDVVRHISGVPSSEQINRKQSFSMFDFMQLSTKMRRFEMTAKRQLTPEEALARLRTRRFTSMAIKARLGRILDER